jgi:phosphoserine aminotransferase
VVIVKRSLYGHKDADTPVMCDWQRYEEAPNGYLNTPPCFSIFATLKNVQFMNQQGGIPHY